MKLKNVHEFDDNIIGAESEQAFTIDTDNHVIFDILRSKMYSDPIAAICREVASNSRDANRENGKGDLPSVISIYEPNQLMSISDMSISFEDNGPGITPSRMGDVFLKYGASTKRDTNSQTGGFGLGAKTPFAYSDTFTIITVCNVDGKKMKYTYTAMIDSSGKGKMVLMDSEEGKGKTGTKIIVPIDEDDRDRFEKECIKATMFWETPPVLKYFRNESPLLTKVYEKGVDLEEDWSAVYDEEGYLGSDRHWVALIDGIAYFLDSTQVNVSRSLETSHIILMNFKNGDLTISANREQLQYDEATIETINKEINKVKKHLTRKITNMIKKSKTYIGACVSSAMLGKGIDKYNEKTFKGLDGETLFLRSVYSWLNRDNSVQKQKTWNGKKIVHNLNIPGIHIELVRPDDKGKSLYDSYAKLDSAWERYPIIYKDIKTKDNRRNSTIFKENDAFLLIEGSGINLKPEYAEAQLDFVMNWGIDFTNYSDIEQDKNHVVKGSAQYYKKQEEVSVECFMWRPDESRGGGKYTTTWLRSQKDLEDGADIIWAQHHSLNENKYGRPYTLDKQAKAVSKIMDKTVIIVNERSAKLYCADSSAMKLEDAIEMIKNDKKYQSKIQAATNVETAKSALAYIDEDLEKFLGVVSPISARLREIVKQGSKIDFDATLFNMKPTIKDYSDEIEKFYEDWKNENWMFESALDSISWDLKYERNKDETSKKLAQIKEAMAAIQIIKETAPTVRRASVHIKAGSLKPRRGISAVYLAK